MSAFRLFEPSAFESVEDLDQYTSGGYCPVDIGNRFNDGRYDIVHKLGWGGFSTVWLAFDSRDSQYVALKILTSQSSEDSNELRISTLLKDKVSHIDIDSSSFFLLPLDTFAIDSPNGRHLALVYSVAGPTVPFLGRGLPEGKLTAQVARDFSLQAAKAMAFLHVSGVGHGDFTPKNILLSLRNLDTFPRDQVMSMFGRVYQEKILQQSENTADRSHAPTYCVEAAEAQNIPLDLIEPRIKVIDFGEAFELSSPPPGGLGTPRRYLAPEVLFDNLAGAPSDVWALACILFEFRAGMSLFSGSSFVSGGEEDEVLASVVDRLGKFPDRWWLKWQGKEAFFDRDGDGLGDKDGEEPLLLQDLKLFGTEEYEQAEKISEQEANSLFDLLSKMLKYEPEERISIEEVLEHAWFRGVYE